MDDRPGVTPSGSAARDDDDADGPDAGRPPAGAAAPAAAGEAAADGPPPDGPAAGDTGRPRRNTRPEGYEPL